MAAAAAAAACVYVPTAYAATFTSRRGGGVARPCSDGHGRWWRHGDDGKLA